MENCDLKNNCLELDGCLRESAELREENNRLKEQLACLRSKRREQLIEVVNLREELRGGPAPRRPGHTTCKWAQTSKKNKDMHYILCDLERECLKELHDKYNGFDYEPCFRRNRLAHPEWIQTVKSHVYPHSSDVDWDEYCERVRAGEGIEEMTVTWRELVFGPESD